MKHREGSRKSKVHALFDSQGPEAAWTLGKKLQLAESTIRSWLWQFGNATAKTKVKTIKKPKAKAQAKVKVAKVVKEKPAQAA